MYKIYFRQAVELLKQNPFIGLISVLGTALAIMMVTTMIVTDGIKNASVVPEPGRDRTLYLVSYAVCDTTGGRNTYSSWGGIPFAELKNNILPGLKTPELIAATGETDNIVNREGDGDYVNMQIKTTNADYWKLCSHTFVEGGPYGDDDFESGLRVAVLSETVAKTLFKGEDPIGKNIGINFNPYRVIGVVRDVSPLFRVAGGGIWAPYTSMPGYESELYEVMLLARDVADFRKIRREMEEVKRKLDPERAPKFVDFGGPRSHVSLSRVSLRGTTVQVEAATRRAQRKTVFLFAVMLLVPALNLSGFSLSRIRKRMAEIGIRKAFGAKRHVILAQVLYENLITTLIGGIAGLGLSYGAIFVMRKWLFDMPSDGSLPLNALVSGYTFAAVFAVCLVLNLISAGVPAYRASRMNIVDSLNQNHRK